MTTRDQVVSLMHRRTRGVCTDLTVMQLPIRLADLLAVLELCGVVTKPPPEREDKNRCGACVKETNVNGESYPHVVHEPVAKQPSTIAEAREAAIKAGDIALGKRVP